MPCAARHSLCDVRRDGHQYPCQRPLRLLGVRSVSFVDRGGGNGGGDVGCGNRGGDGGGRDGGGDEGGEGGGDEWCGGKNGGEGGGEKGGEKGGEEACLRLNRRRVEGVAVECCGATRPRGTAGGGAWEAVVAAVGSDDGGGRGWQTWQKDLRRDTSEGLESMAETMAA